MTMQVIQHIELGSAQANIEFTSIPQIYTDLYLVCSTRSQRSGTLDGLRIRLGNGAIDTGNNYFSRFIQGFNNGVGSFSGPADRISGLGNSANDATANTFGNAMIYIPNYTAAVAKSVSADSVSETNSSEAGQYISAGLWNSTSAITNLRLFNDIGSNFAAGSSATLYGITKGSDGITTVS